MAKLVITEYLPEHLELLKPRACHAGEGISEIHGPAVTYTHEELPLAIVGVYEFTPGVHQAWGVLSEQVTEHSLSFHRSLCLLLAYYADRKEARRIQMSVRVGYDMGLRWAKSLGFEEEGVMKKYGPDSHDYVLCARVF